MMAAVIVVGRPSAVVGGVGAAAYQLLCGRCVVAVRDGRRTDRVAIQFPAIFFFSKLYQGIHTIFVQTDSDVVYTGF